jgi:dolichol-phosphate mannosyltransferase
MSRSSACPTLLRRFSRFGLVGAGGILVQLLALGTLLRCLDVHYLVATALAVEASVIFNFVWHQRWTWKDRPSSNHAMTFVRFNLSNGAVSVFMNVLLMSVFVGFAGLRPLLANLLSIAVCAAVNFTLADRFVFV